MIQQHSIRTLLVEDDPADASFMREALAETTFDEFELTHVKRLEDAITLLKRDRFDVTVLDLGLPDSQGLDTLKRLRSVSRKVAIVVMTGLSNESLGMQALHEGAQDYVVKGETDRRILRRAIRYSVERRHIEENLAHLSRLNTMGQIVSGLAHELNQPLSAIMNYASVCQMQIEGAGTKETMLKAIGEVMSETRRAGTLISRLSSFIRKQKPQSELLDINGLVEDSVDLLEFEFRHHKIKPQLSFTRDLPLVLADAVQIEQALVNLVYNAFEAMDRAQSPVKKLMFLTQKDDANRMVEVSVIDSGPGVAPENMNRLFEAFFTTKPTGMGMGLNICKSIIESHGGRLSASRNPEGGMSFSFTLPVTDGESNGKSENSSHH